VASSGKASEKHAFGESHGEDAELIFGDMLL
jgi:hypothetical protein